jgi:hypothetical protein
MVKEGNRFVITHLLNAKMGIEVLLQEMQLWPLQPDNKVERCQQYSRCRYLAAMRRDIIDLPDLLIGKLTKIGKQK